MIEESFQNLLEINSLFLKIHDLELASKAELKRISAIESAESQKMAALEAKKDQLKAIHLKEKELEISKIVDLINRHKTQLNLITTQKELDSLTHEIENNSKILIKLEAEYFQNLEHSEILHLEIKDFESFLEGIKITKKEIEAEVNEKTTTGKKEIENFQKRVDALIDTCDKSVKSIFSDFVYKKKITDPIAFINNKNCSRCKINLDAATIQSVEHKKSIEICPNCNRILLTA